MGLCYGRALMEQSHAAQAVFVPLAAGWVPAPPAGARLLWLNAQDGPGRAVPPGTHITAQQDFRPFALPLIRAGLDVRPDVTGDDYNMVLLCGRKQRAEQCGALALALSRLPRGGTLIVAADNDAGGRRLAADAAALGLNLAAESKHHCRILFGRVDDYDRATAQAWMDDAAPRAMMIDDGTTEWTQPGLFGWDRRDPGTALLRHVLPDGLAGVVADLGCGGGVLLRHVLARNPDVSAAYGLEADARAVDMARRNLDDARAVIHWHAVAQEEIALPPCDTVVMNPPFHAGRRTDADIGLRFIDEAARLLRPGGRLWMVANAHLPYEQRLRADFRTVRKVIEDFGYKVYEAVK